jgi:nucleotide-binding universal stress UspA family protein
VLTQAALGYELTAAGIDVRGSGGLPAVVDAMVVDSPLPALLLQPGPNGAREIRRILLPVSATRASRAAGEVAIALAAATGATLLLLHVGAGDPAGAGRRMWRATVRSSERTIASFAGSPTDRLLTEVEEAAGESDVRVERISVAHDSRGAAIVAAGQQFGSELIVLGVDAQNMGGQAFLGQTTEHVLRNARSGVIVVAL